VVAYLEFLGGFKICDSNGEGFEWFDFQDSMALSYLGLKLNFWPPIAASYIKPPFIYTNIAIPFL
jgi:hypothetical protein